MTNFKGKQARRWLAAIAALGLAFVGALLFKQGQVWAGLLIVFSLTISAIMALAGDAEDWEKTAPLAKQRLASLRKHTRPWMLWLALSVGCKVPVPLYMQGFVLLGLLSTICLFMAALSYAWQQFGPSKALQMMALACGVGLLAELVGSHSGVPFGVYSYAGAPAPLLLGVPLVVPLGWFAFSLAAGLLSGGRVWLAGLLLALWDVGLEPLMTTQGYWHWHDARPLWAGAPLQNFVGWFAIGGLIVWGMGRIVGKWPKTRGLTGSFAMSYPIESCFLPAGLLLLGRWPEALITFLAMWSGLVVVSLTRSRPR